MPSFSSGAKTVERCTNTAQHAQKPTRTRASHRPATPAPVPRTTSTWSLWRRWPSPLGMCAHASCWGESHNRTTLLRLCATTLLLRNRQLSSIRYASDLLTAVLSRESLLALSLGVLGGGYCPALAKTYSAISHNPPRKFPGREVCLLFLDASSSVLFAPALLIGLAFGSPWTLVPVRASQPPPSPPTTPQICSTPACASFASTHACNFASDTHGTQAIEASWFGMRDFGTYHGVMMVAALFGVFALYDAVCAHKIILRQAHCTMAC